MDRIETLNQKCWQNRTADAWNRGISAAGSAIISAKIFTFHAFATDTTTATGTDTISPKISSGLQTAWGVLKAIGIPVAVIAVAICAFQFFLNSEKGMEAAKKKILYIIIGIALLFLAPVIITTIQGWFDNNAAWVSTG